MVWYAFFIYVTQYHVVPKSLDIAKHQRVNDRLAGKIHLIFADQWKGKSLTVRSNELFVPNRWTGNRLPSAGQPFTLLSRALDLSAKGDRDEIWRMHCNGKLLKSQFIILSKEREERSILRRRRSKLGQFCEVQTSNISVQQIVPAKEIGVVIANYVCRKCKCICQTQHFD